MGRDGRGPCACPLGEVVRWAEMDQQGKRKAPSPPNPAPCPYTWRDNKNKQRRPRMSAIPIRRHRRANWVAVLWTAPALAFYAVFALVPLLVAVYLSFVRWDGISQVTWVGLKN